MIQDAYAYIALCGCLVLKSVFDIVTLYPFLFVVVVLRPLANLIPSHLQTCRGTSSSLPFAIRVGSQAELSVSSDSNLSSFKLDRQPFTVTQLEKDATTEIDFVSCVLIYFQSMSIFSCY